MIMTPGLRKFALTVHVASSVGWLGAVAGFLALAITGLTSEDAQTVRAAYLAMWMTGWSVIVPLGLASLPTGFVMSLGTEWGLFRHYWILAKLLITVVATILLLLHMRPVGHLARVVTETTLAQGEMAGLRIQLVADAGAALVALLAATALSVYKPRGMTLHGRQKQREQFGSGRVADLGSTVNIPRWVQVFGILVFVLILLIIVQHLGGGGHGH